PGLISENHEIKVCSLRQRISKSQATVVLPSAQRQAFVPVTIHCKTSVSPPRARDLSWPLSHFIQPVQQHTTTARHASSARISVCSTHRLASNCHGQPLTRTSNG
ncbi:hypothetical protein RB213_002613, partial [Colletotrichum asianum]